MHKSNLARHARISGIVCGLALTAGLFVYKAKADDWNRQTVLNVGQTIQIEDTVLQPGKYVLKALDSPSNRHIVQIFNADENRVFATVLTIPAERTTATGDTKLIFWETPAGDAKALRTWYYPGRLSGDEFTYPKHPYQLAQAQPAPVAAAPPPTPEPAPSPVAETPAPEPQRPVEIAQNTPPPPPPTQPAPAQTTDATPTTLPQTASPYPLFGFAGLGSLALFGLLRLTDSRTTADQAE
jgi:hypothetical protein